MFKTLRIALILIGLVFTLLFFNNQIRTMNVIAEDGVSVMFKLRPVDPRAFMQGDYMALRYSEDSLPVGEPDAPASGVAIVKIDNKGIGTFARLSDGSALGPNEIRINYARKIRNDLSYGGERYFFQEGSAERFEAAEYGIFKVSPKGRAILVGLAGEDLKIIKP